MENNLSKTNIPDLNKEQPKNGGNSSNADELDVTKYAKPEFNQYQMENIYKGLKELNIPDLNKEQPKNGGNSSNADGPDLSNLTKEELNELKENIIDERLDLSKLDSKDSEMNNRLK